MRLEAKAKVLSVGGGSIEFALDAGGEVNLSATRDQERAWATRLYEAVTIVVELPDVSAKGGA